jgi:hypothetical protein
VRRRDGCVTEPDCVEARICVTVRLAASSPPSSSESVSSSRGGIISGISPSLNFKTKTMFHSRPFAWCTVDNVTTSGLRRFRASAAAFIRSSNRRAYETNDARRCAGVTTTRVASGDASTVDAAANATVSATATAGVGII